MDPFHTYDAQCGALLPRFNARLRLVAVRSWEFDQGGAPLEECQLGHENRDFLWRGTWKGSQSVKDPLSRDHYCN
jgi:hypothetical protein